MNWSQLQRPILFVPRVSLQRWVLTALALTAAVGATTFTSLAADHRSGVVLVLVIALALASVVNPDTHVATGTVVLVLWQWFVTTDDTTTPWTVPVAACLFVFHTLVALMAVTPIGATIRVSVLVDWTFRSSYVLLATVGMWALVAVMTAWRPDGSGTLTLVGFLTLAGLILASRVNTEKALVTASKRKPTS